MAFSKHSNDKSALDKIFRKVHKDHEQEEQSAFWRTHNARSRAKQARIKAQRERGAGGAARDAFGNRI